MDKGEGYKDSNFLIILLLDYLKDQNLSDFR